jgi:hypothetical protein
MRIAAKRRLMVSLDSRIDFPRRDFAPAHGGVRVGPVENLVPPGELRVVGVGPALGDDTLQVSVEYRPVKRPPFTDYTIGDVRTLSGLLITCPLIDRNFVAI